MVLVAIPRVCNASEYYMDKVYVNPKKKKLYVATRKYAIFKQIYHATIGKMKKKLLEFYICFHMLVKGCKHMINYENMNKLLHFP